MPEWVDLNSIPGWVIITLLFLNFFKEKIYQSVDWLGKDLTDRREHAQRQSDLQAAYQQSEQAVAQQLLSELVSNAQESERGANKYIRESYTRLLDTYVELAESQRKLEGRLSRVEHQIREDATHKRLLTSFVTDIYEKVIGKKPTT